MVSIDTLIEKVNPGRIHLIQMLCPRRHCFAAIAYDPKDGDVEGAIECLKDAIKENDEKHNLPAPRCSFCNSAEFYFEVGITKFLTMEEAEPEIERVYKLQAESVARVTKERYLSRN